jgi:membrane protease YdiL (CAAX protease family)
MTLRGLLLGLTPGRMLQLSVLSALSEELLFRALLVPMMGLVPSALVFGVLHISPRGTSVAWPVWAFAMGVSFGALFEASGTLFAPILAHALINYENMQYISNYDPSPLEIDRPGRREVTRKSGLRR